MSDISCTSYSPGHNVHFIQARHCWENPSEVAAVELIAIHGHWFDVLIGGRRHRGWNHDAAHVREFFAAGVGEGAGGLPEFPDPAEAAARGREEFLELHHNDTYRGQIIWHKAGGGSLTVNHGDGTRGNLSVCWGEPEECHVAVRRFADGVVVS